MSLSKRQRTDEVNLHDCVPMEILKLIFNRLPPKDAGIMQRVCKMWFTIIDEKFKTEHTKNDSLEATFAKFLFKINKEPLIWLYIETCIRLSNGHVMDLNLTLDRADEDSPCKTKYILSFRDDNFDLVELYGIGVAEMKDEMKCQNHGECEVYDMTKQEAIKLLNSRLFKRPIGSSVKLRNFPTKDYHPQHPITAVESCLEKESGIIPREQALQLLKNFSFFRAILMYLNKW